MITNRRSNCGGGRLWGLALFTLTGAPMKDEMNLPQWTKEQREQAEELWRARLNKIPMPPYSGVAELLTLFQCELTAVTEERDRLRNQMGELAVGGASLGEVVAVLRKMRELSKRDGMQWGPANADADAILACYPAPPSGEQAATCKRCGGIGEIGRLEKTPGGHDIHVTDLCPACSTPVEVQSPKGEVK